MADSDDFPQKSTDELKQAVLHLVAGRDEDSLGKKAQFYKTELAALFAELQKRNPVPLASDQVSLVQGVWLSLWSTIPFQDIFPGRIRDQSYQIFHPDGYYANMARYAPGSRIPLLKKLSSWLVAYDFMLIQRYEVSNQQWFIQNVGIEQTLRIRARPFTVDVADAWFTKAVTSPKLARFKNLDQPTAKKVEKILQATPQLEHLYCDPDFRIVKTQREANQRASYTIAIRKS
ncbi:hypothetical protein H6G89_19100 [Oscillatoria sp. FACHB-1407]|uniref:hypothetical protein n=1 Tax=Oscillatoria sp. FACHB-1407 TaxID=2692847 RepID=UPI00168392C7|nr:hypothetical protein [Oscillatoria sp. FACHB-1407]MBD2463147.1 hypothetical protein [Oscillatoria sp. FACHB-1407]